MSNHARVSSREGRTQIFWAVGE
eukprot:SAG11_NODE_30304_length_302_cov_0.758621_1_plen_22_part_10